MSDEYEPESIDPPPPWESAGKRGGERRGKDLRRNTKPLGPASRRLARKLNTRRRLLVIGAVSLALLVVALLSFWQLGERGPFATQSLQMTPPISLAELATEYPELATILSDPKLDSAYKDFLVAYQDGGGEAALELARQRGLLNANGDLRLTLELSSDQSGPLQQELEANGIQVTAVSGNLMDVAVPLGLLERLMAAGTADNLLSTITNLEHVERIRLPQEDIPDQEGQETPAASPSAVETPAAAAPMPEAGPDILGSKSFMIGLGVLLCVVAPLLLGLGVYLLVSGLGLSRRKIAATDTPPSVANEAGSAPITGQAVWMPPASPPAQEALPPVIPGQTPPPTVPEAARPRSAESAVTVPEAVHTKSPAPIQAAQTGKHQPPLPAGAETMREESQRPEGGPVEPADAPTVRPAAAERSQGGEAQSPPPTVPAESPMLAAPCRRCGFANRPGAKFCASCGASLQPDEPPMEPMGPALVGTPTPQPTKAPPTVTDKPVDSAPAERPTFCWNCGQRLRPTSLFCPYCGDRI